MKGYGALGYGIWIMITDLILAYMDRLSLAVFPLDGMVHWVEPTCLVSNENIATRPYIMTRIILFW